MITKRFTTARRAWMGAACAALLFGAPTVAWAQANWGGAPIMVCQTDAFWCAFPGSAADGVPCYCNSSSGPVTGRTINPRLMSLPEPPPKTVLPSQRPSLPPADAELRACLNGEALCPGAFTGAIRR